MIAARLTTHAALACALLAGTSGCRAIAELIESDGADGDPLVDGGPNADAREGPDADVDCTTWSFTPTFVDPCDAPAPTGGLFLGPGVWIYDTNSGALTDPNQDATFPTSVLFTPASGPEIRIVSVDTIYVADGAELRVYGNRPVVLLSWASATVTGTVSATSDATRTGAGGDPEACPDAPTSGEDFADGAGGGGGGGFGEPGAPGGTGRDMMAAAGEGGPASPAPDALRGGCPGGPGGNELGGAGGAGGGAVQILARDTITVDGTITAGGAGGGAANGGRGGGGGGGAGGLIGLEASEVTVHAGAVLAANGGGGGGGSDNDPASPGQPGQADAVAAAGGNGQGMGEDGGAGGVADVAAEPGVDSGRGGGGGGGGVGYVLLEASTLDVDGAAVVTPAAE